MKLWQFKVSMKAWADDGTNEYKKIKVGDEFPQSVKPVHNKINHRIGDIVLYYNSKSKVVQKRGFLEGIYLVCKVVSNVDEFYYIKLKVIKDLREAPYMYNKDYHGLHEWHNTAKVRGRAQTYEEINIDYCNIEQFHEKLMFDNNTHSLIDDIEEIQNNNNIDKTEKENLVKTRLGQGSFRDDLIEYWNGLCSVTGFDNANILIASHIKPWKDCTNNERLDKYNGFLLTPTLDKLFDKHYISFDCKGKIMISDKLKNLDKICIDKNMKIQLKSNHEKYLKTHRDKFEKQV